jgi:hypothetical protein
VPDREAATTPDLPVRLVRLRDDVSPAGEDSPARVVHLVPQPTEETVGDGSGDVGTCCGGQLVAGTWEDVAWGTLWPHAVCVERARVRRSVLERAFQAAENESSSSDEEWASSFKRVEKIVNQREDWTNAKDSEDWVYTASFNGALTGEYRFPRGVDVGLEPLSVELVRPYVFRVHSCGVRDGCPKHAVQAETFSLDEPVVIGRRLTLQEHRALDIDLQELAWCLIFGACSKTTLTLSLR